MTSSHLLLLYLWIAPHLLLAVISVWMIRRKLYRPFPMFFLYVNFEILQFIVLLVVNYSEAISHERYHLIFSIGAVGSTVLRFCIIYEIFTHFFQKYPSLRNAGRTGLRWTAGALVLLSVLLSVGASTGGEDHLRLLASVLDRAFSIVQCGLLIAMFLFSNYFGLSWRNFAFGIALGFGIFASVELASSAIRSQVGLFGNRFLDFFTMGTYHLCVLIWLFYVLTPEQSSKSDSGHLPEHDLETWNQELQKLILK